MNTFSRKDLDSIQDITEKAIGIKLEISELPFEPLAGVKFAFHYFEKVEVPYEAEKEGNKRFTVLLSKVRDGICEKFKQGEVYKGLVADHKKEVEAFSKIIEEKDKEIAELTKYKHHFELEADMRRSLQPTGANPNPGGRMPING